MSAQEVYKFYLWFKNDDVTMEIEEPFTFNAFSYSVERKRNGFSVDTHLFAENTTLLFTNSAYSTCGQHEDIDGTMLFNLTHGLKRIIDSYQEHGPDGEIELRITFNELLLTKCDFDMEDIDTDLKSYFKCGFIENNVRSKHKIREDDVIINVYSDKNLDGDTIVPLQPIKVLLLSKPTYANSKWLKTDIPYTGAPGNVTTKFPAGVYIYFNFSKLIVESGIEDTISPSALDASNTYTETFNGTMKMIDCKTSKKAVKLIVTSDVSFTHIQNGRVGWPNNSSLALMLRVSTGTGIGQSVEYTLYSQQFTGTATQTATVPPVIDFDLPTGLNEGEFVTLYWAYSWDSGTIALTSDYNRIDNYSHVNFNDCVVEMSVVEETINSVIQGVRWIDLLKKSSEIISGLPVDAPRIDVGGEYYDTIVCNGGGVRNISNIPFNIKAKDAFEIGMMVALDYQVTEENVMVGEYKDFFSNRLLRTFNIKPSETFTWNTNKEYRIKTFDYKFKNYEQDRQEQRTLDAVHTEEQLLMPNKKTINTRTVSIDAILDAYKIDSLRRLGIDVETKDSSLTDDNDLAMIKIAALSGLHLEKYIGLLRISTIPGGIKIYTGVFRWDKIGLGLTSSFSILTGLNTGSYNVIAIESSVLTLNTISPIINVSENKILTIEYSLEGVQYISETDQDFDTISGVISPETYTNLFYSKLRNIQKWLPFLATCCMRYFNSNIKVSFLKSNQELITKRTGEVNTLNEASDIIISEISELKLITDRKFKTTIYVQDPTDIEDIFSELNVRNTDGTIGGYYEFIDPSGNVIKGYPEKLEYIPLENKIEAECLEKYELGNGFINLTSSASYSQYASYGVYITIYKTDGTLFCKEKRFTKIKINGIIYTDLQLFLNDLEIYLSL